MYTKVLPSISPNKIKYPYHFEITQKNIYSLEELYYHCYYYWKESIDDFIMGKLEDWIREELDLPSIANQIASTKEKNSKCITKQYIDFLGIIDYFSDKELYLLGKEIFRWEHKHEWEKAKDKGDLYIRRGEYEKAIEYYEKALQYTEDSRVLNNIGIAYMERKQYEKAYQYLFAAYTKTPQNIKILFNLSFVAQQQKEYKKAEEFLKEALSIKECGEGWYYYGQLQEKLENEEEAYLAYQRSITFSDSIEGFLALARWYRQRNQVDQALQVIEQLPSKHNWGYYIEKAKILEQQKKSEDGIQLLQEAFHTFTPHPQGFIMLSKLYRTTNQKDQASKIIQQALQLYPNNDAVKLEWARVQKKEGKIKNYQEILKDILFGWIQKYRNPLEKL
ncbi:MAG: tetratricopeptide repeat protein [Epulopiscium sp.]|nr:tetratricopeptide repeat protein [Candidatus Epulonipiscium sp.]